VPSDGLRGGGTGGCPGPIRCRRSRLGNPIPYGNRGRGQILRRLQQLRLGANGRLLHLRYLQAGNLLQGYHHSYDASGNRTQMFEQPGSGPSITWDYGYDWLDRLISVKT